MSHGTADFPRSAGDPDRSGDFDQTLTMPALGSTARQNGSSPDGQLPFDDLAEPEWPDDDLPGVTERGGGFLAGELAAGLASLPAVGAAIRRRVRMCCMAGVIGFLLGTAIYVVHPPAYEASTSVLVTQNPLLDPLDAVQTDVALVQSRTVAQLAMKHLGILKTESVFKFQESYTVVALTDRVLLITIGAPSSAEAIQRASALAHAYLNFRDSMLWTERQETLNALQGKVNYAQTQISSIAYNLGRAEAQRPSPAQRALVARLKADRKTWLAAQSTLAAEYVSFQVQSEVTTASMVKGSGVLDKAAALPRSKYKKPEVYVIGGLLAGLLVGLAIVIITELVTDKLRRRDDVAKALGAPVLLSVGKVWAGRWPARLIAARYPMTVAGGAEMQRVIGCLRRAVTDDDGPATLAVVTIDETKVATVAVAALAVAAAQAGLHVIVADLTADRTIARLTGVRESGVRIATIEGQQLVIAVPDRGDISPVGPVRVDSMGPRTAGPALAAAYGSADLLITLANLDPALGADYLASWSPSVVAVLTAGTSSATKIHSVGEMIRFSGAQLRGAILLGADKRDETVGILSSGRPAFAMSPAAQAAAAERYVDRQPPPRSEPRANGSHRAENGSRQAEEQAGRRRD